MWNFIRNHDLLFSTDAGVMVYPRLLELIRLKFNSYVIHPATTVIHSDFESMFVLYHIFEYSTFDHIELGRVCDFLSLHGEIKNHRDRQGIHVLSHLRAILLFEALLQLPSLKLT